MPENSFTQSLADSFSNTQGHDMAHGLTHSCAPGRRLHASYRRRTAVGALRNLLFAGLVGGGIDE